jgi:hypothetical protein
MLENAIISDEILLKWIPPSMVHGIVTLVAPTQSPFTCWPADSPGQNESDILLSRDNRNNAKIHL